MPSTKKPVSFRPGDARLARFAAALEQIVVDGDDRRGGFGTRPADCPTATEVYCAMMDDFVSKVEARKSSALRMLSAKGARYRGIVEP